MKRNLTEVINQMLEVIPETEVDLVDNLVGAIANIEPLNEECRKMWWPEVRGIILGHMQYKPVEDWQFKILSIYSTRTVDGLKASFKNQPER